MQIQEEIIDNFITINSAYRTIKEAIIYLPDIKDKCEKDLEIIASTLMALFAKNIDMTNQDELYLFNMTLKQINFMIMELFDYCKDMLNKGDYGSN